MRHKKTGQMNRRGFLKALGIGSAGAACLPLLHSEGLAANGQFPTRFVVFFSANGTIPERWRPVGTETNWSFGQHNFGTPNEPDIEDDILRPLEPHKSKISVLDGLDMISARNGPGDGHQTGMGHMLTGTELLSGDTKGGCGSCPAAGYSTGPSVDQYIAQQIHDGEVFESLTFGVQAGGPNNWTRMSYAGRDRPVEPRQDPFDAFDRIFESVGIDERNLERIRSRRASVLDVVRQDLRDIQSKVSAEDRQRIERHAAAVRELEMNLMIGDAQGIACEAPAQGQRFDHREHENFPATGRSMMDLIATSLACGLTRVASIQWSRSVSNITHPWANVTNRHHDLSHEGDGNMDAKQKLVRINRWYAEQFAYLIDKLDSMPEGDGTVLDHTVVIWTNELGKGNSHTRNNVPIVMAGGGGFFQMGRHFTWDQHPHNDLLVSLCNAMGVSTNTFGNPAYCNGPLTRIHA
ncbi:MAG: DUF1552 domain-containing protein [Myxococcota bacterium]